MNCIVGAKLKVKRRKLKPSVLAISMENVSSLSNTTDELWVLVKKQREYRECSYFFFPETWLYSYFPDHSVAVPGFRTVREDRDVVRS